VTLEQRIVRGFLRQHPRAAARVLELSTEEEALDVLSQSEPAETAAVLEVLVPSAASKHLDRLAPGLAASVLERLSSDRAADLARRMRAERRADLLARIDEAIRAPIERLLRFPVGSAGALMNPHFAAYHVSRSAEEALAELKGQGTDLRYYLYVVDDALVLVGVLGVRDLVASSPDVLLGDVMRHPVATLSARAGRNAILSHPGWKRFPSLPVVDEGGRLVGVFPYRTFQELKGAPGEDGDPGGLGLALALAELFWWGASSLFRGMERNDDDQARS